MSPLNASIAGQGVGFQHFNSCRNPADVYFLFVGDSFDRCGWALNPYSAQSSGRALLDFSDPDVFFGAVPRGRDRRNYLLRSDRPVEATDP